MLATIGRHLDRRTSIVGDLAAYAALTCLALYVLRDALGGERLYSLWVDNEFHVGPVFSQIARAFAAGEVPLRMEAILGGFPLYNFTQATPFYPLYGFHFGGYETHLETVHKLHRLTVLHVVIGVLAMHYLLRSLGLSRMTAAAGAVLYGLSADMASYKMFVNIVAPYAWLPLFVAGLIGLLTDSRRRLNFVLCAFSAAMIALASPSQPLIHAVLVALFLCMAYLASAEARVAPGRGVLAVARVGFAGLVAVFLCAPLLIPTVLDAPKMLRWIGDVPPILQSERIPFDAFVLHKLPSTQAAGILFSGERLSLVGHPYVGFFIVPLVMLALFLKRTWVVYGFCALALYGLWSAFGDDLWLAYLNHAIPLLNKIREPSRNLVLFQFGSAALAAIGIASIAQVGTAGGRERRMALIALVTSCVFCVLVFLVVALGKGVTRTDTGLFIGALALHVVSIYLLRRDDGKALAPLLAAAWAAGVATNLVVAVSWTPPLRFSDSLYVREDLAPLDAALDFVARQPDGTDRRVIFDGKFDKRHAAMLAGYRDLRAFDYYLITAPLKQAVAVSYEYSPYYLYYGAGYLICEQCDRSKYPGFEQLQQFGDYGVFRNRQGLGRYYVGHVVGEAADSAEFERKIKTMGSMSSDPGVYIQRNAVLDASSPPIAREPTPVPCTIAALETTATKKTLSVGCSPGQLLVLNEFNDGNWVASINGSRVETIVVNGNQVAVVLRSATQIVSFEYWPKSFFWSLTLVPTGALLLAALLWRTRAAPVARTLDEASETGSRRVS